MHRGFVFFIITSYFVTLLRPHINCDLGLYKFCANVFRAIGQSYYRQGFEIPIPIPSVSSVRNIGLTYVFRGKG